MRKQIAAANWKMNLSFPEALTLAENLKSGLPQQSANQLVLLAVPFPYLYSIRNIFADSDSVFVTAQNVHHLKSGAYTGEVSASMLSSIKIKYALVGHSERREYFAETNKMLAEKVDLLITNNITPVFCCGEPLDVREKGEEVSYVKQQLEESLFHLTADQMKNFIIAYEPIWAIGTGKTATAEQAQDMHAALRNCIAEKYGNDIAQSVSILYGGSVKADNATDIFGRNDVDGGLVGGASLVAADFIKIASALK